MIIQFINYHTEKVLVAVETDLRPMKGDMIYYPHESHPVGDGKWFVKDNTPVWDLQNGRAILKVYVDEGSRGW